MNNKKKGIFISFEGPEAAGKSTQIIQLKKFLKKNKIPYILSREPGGTKVSEILRKIILNNKFQISITEEILLLMASRLNHINNVIKPAISEGKLIISDRYADSTFVYQGFANNYLRQTMNLHKKLLNNFFPKKTFLFLLSPKEIIKRLNKRKNFNKFDKFDIKFHQKIINGYKKISKNDKRFVVINAEKSFDFIQNELQNKIIKLVK